MHKKRHCFYFDLNVTADDEKKITRPQRKSAQQS